MCFKEKHFIDTFKTLIDVSNGQLKLFLDKDEINVNLVASLKYHMNLDDDFDAWDCIDHLDEDDVLNIICHDFPLENNYSDENNNFMQNNYFPCELSCV